MDQLQTILSLHAQSVGKVFLKYGITTLTPEWLLIGVVSYKQPFIDDITAQIKADNIGAGYSAKTSTGDTVNSAFDIGAILGTVLNTVINNNNTKTDTTQTDATNNKGFTYFIVGGVFLIILLGIFIYYKN